VTSKPYWGSNPATGPVSICLKCSGLCAISADTPCPRPARDDLRRQYKPICGGQVRPLTEDELAAWKLGGDPAVRDLVRARRGDG